MDLRDNDKNDKASVNRFESMLKTNDILFFDSSEFEDIITHYLYTGIFPLAKKAVKMGLSQHPNNVDLKLLKVEILIMEEKLEEAESLLDEIHLIEPYNEDIYIHKSKLYSKHGANEKAIAVLKDALPIASDKGQIYTLIGMEFLEIRKYLEALDFFKKAVERDGHEDMLFYVVYCYSLLERRDKGVDFLIEFLERHPYTEEGWYYLGKEYIAQKEYNKAVAALDFAIICEDTFLGAYLEKGKALEGLKNYQEALEAYIITTELDDPTDIAYLGIGRCYENLGKDSLAVKYFQMAREYDPLGEKAIIALSDFYERKGNYLKALEYITEGLDTEEHNMRFWKRYGRLNHTLNFLEEAEHGYDMALENGNYEIDLWIKRGDILISMGRFETAIKNFEDAEDFYRGWPELEYRFAGIYYSLYDSDRGNYHLDRALKADQNKVSILQQQFPRIFARKSVQNRIVRFRNSKHQGKLSN